MMQVALIEGRKLFQPLIDVLDKPFFIVVNIDSRSDVHGGNQDHAVLHATVTHNLFHLRSDMHIFTMPLGIERKIFSMEFHETSKKLMTDSTFGPLRPLWAHIKIYIVQTRKPGICGSVLARLWGEDAPFVELLELSKEKNNDRKKVRNNIRAFGFCVDVGGACSIELRNAQTRSQYFTRFLAGVRLQP